MTKNRQNTSNAQITPRGGNSLVPVLLVMTYFTFMFLPNQFWFWNNIFKFNVDEDLMFDISWFFYSLAYTSDGIIYIFLSPVIKRNIKRRWRNLFTTRRVYPQESQTVVTTIWKSLYKTLPQHSGVWLYDIVWCESFIVDAKDNQIKQ